MDTYYAKFDILNDKYVTIHVTFYSYIVPIITYFKGYLTIILQWTKMAMHLTFDKEGYYIHPLSPLTWQRELWHIGQSKFGMNFFDKKLTLMYPKQYLSMNCKDNNLCWSFSFDMNKSSILLRYKNVYNNIQQWLTFSFKLVFSLQSILLSYCGIYFYADSVSMLAPLHLARFH